MKIRARVTLTFISIICVRSQTFEPFSCFLYGLLMKKIVCILSLTAMIVCCHPLEDRYLEDNIVVDEDQRQKNTLIDQNKWMYGQMKNQYYWTNDIPDSALLDFTKTSPLFFHSMKSSKDRFSWIEPNSSYSGESAFDKFGFEYQAYLLPNGEKIYRVLFVTKDSPAFSAGLKRGMWFISSDNIGKSQHNLSVTIGAFRNNTFEVGKESPLVMINAKSATQTYAVQLDTVYNISGRKIGYFVYNQFEDAGGNIVNPFRRELREMFQCFADSAIQDLIIDLRYNPGGYVSTCQYLCSLILPDEFLETVYGYHAFNEALSQEQYNRTGYKEEILYFPSKGDVMQKNIGIRKIYVIITKRTFSASESLVNSLEPLIDVVTVGTNSGGKGVGSWTIKDNRYPYQLQPITFRYYNREHVTVSDNGIDPTIFADETSVNPLYELGDTRELLLSRALDDILGTSKFKSAYIQEQLSILPLDEPLVQSRRITGYQMGK